jgi:hypothetical protein
MPRWPKREDGTEKSFEARRRKPETSKTDLEPPIGVLRRTGCPPRGGIRRVCGEVSGCNRLGETPDEQVGQRWDQVEPALWGRRRYSFTHRTKVFADGTIRKIHA